MFYWMENIILGNQRWNFSSAVYYTLITLSTIGLGDFVPTIQPGVHREEAENKKSQTHHQNKMFLPEHHDQNKNLSNANTNSLVIKHEHDDSKIFADLDAKIGGGDVAIHFFCVSYALLIFLWILFGLVYMKVTTDIICENMKRKLTKRWSAVRNSVLSRNFGEKIRKSEVCNNENPYQ